MTTPPGPSSAPHGTAPGGEPALPPGRLTPARPDRDPHGEEESTGEWHRAPASVTSASDIAGAPSGLVSPGALPLGQPSAVEPWPSQLGQISEPSWEAPAFLSSAPDPTGSAAPGRLGARADRAADRPGAMRANGATSADSAGVWEPATSAAVTSALEPSPQRAAPATAGSASTIEHSRTSGDPGGAPASPAEAELAAPRPRPLGASARMVLAPRRLGMPSWLPLAVPLGLTLLALGFGGGWVAKPTPTATAVAATTVTAPQSATTRATPLPPAPPIGSGKPVGSLNLPASVNDLVQTKGSPRGDVVNAATYMKPGDSASVRTVAVLRDGHVAQLSADAITVYDYATYRCWLDLGLHVCASDVDGGAIVVTAPATSSSQDATAAFMDLLLKAV